MAAEVRTVESFMPRCSACDDLFGKIPRVEWSIRMRHMDSDFEFKWEADGIVKAHNERWHHEEAGG